MPLMHEDEKSRIKKGGKGSNGRERRKWDEIVKRKDKKRNSSALKILSSDRLSKKIKSKNELRPKLFCCLFV